MADHEIKDRILASLPIESYIGRFVTLKKQGRYFKGLCPFHQEKTPSFTVTPEKGLFHCFGCGQGGDLFAFVMAYEKVEFKEALEILARTAGITLEKKSFQVVNQNLFDLNEKVARVFHNEIKRNAAVQDYLRNRQIKDSVIEIYEIGASPEEWSFLEKEIPGRKKELLQLGLLKEASGSDRCYDFFRGRLIFPIRNEAGRVSGFGGRVLPGQDHPAKYVNSPESPVFQKSHILYGLYQAMTDIRRKQKAIIVEGYLDVIGLHQAGIHNAVAPLGTALTESHLKLIQRYSSELLLMLDGDIAGRNAARKTIELLAQFPSFRVSVLLLPAGLDPFDLATSEERGQITELLEKGVSTEKFYLLETILPGLFDQNLDAIKDRSPVEQVYMIQEMLDGRHAFEVTPDTERKKDAVEKLFSFLNGVPGEMQRELYVEYAANILGISLQALKDEKSRRMKSIPEQEYQDFDQGYRKKRPRAQDQKAQQRERGGNAGGHFSAENPEIDESTSKLIRCERVVMTEILVCPAVVSDFLNVLNAIEFQDLESEFLWRYLEHRYSTGDIWNKDVLGAAELPATTLSVFSGLVMERDQDPVETASSKAVVEELLLDHSLILVKKRLATLQREMSLADPLESEELKKIYAGFLKERKRLEAARRGEKDGQNGDSVRSATSEKSRTIQF